MGENKYEVEKLKRYLVDKSIEGYRLELLETIEPARDISKKINYGIGTVHNAGTVLHNKFVELSNEFKKKDLLFRSFEESQQGIIDQSVVGGMIESELLSWLIDARNLFKDFYMYLDLVYMGALPEYRMVEFLNFINRKLSSFGLIASKKHEVAIADREKMVLDKTLDSYKALTTRILNFQIDDSFLSIIDEYILENMKYLIVLSDGDSDFIESYLKSLKEQMIQELYTLEYSEIAKKVEEEVTVKKPSGKIIVYKNNNT